MLKNSKAFSSFSVDDLEKAKDFYQNTLGLDVREGLMGILELRTLDSSPILIYPKQNHIPASFTVLNFTVESVEDAVGILSNKGVQFEHYDEENLKTDEKGISRSEGPVIAWFKDPAGNILSILEEK